MRQGVTEVTEIWRHCHQCSTLGSGVSLHFGILR